MIDIYYWPTPNGHKITIYCEETGLPYRIVPVDIRSGEQFKPDFLKISPNNRMPAIIDPDGRGGSRFRFSSPARFFCTSGRRPASCCPRRRVRSTRSSSG